MAKVIKMATHSQAIELPRDLNSTGHINKQTETARREISGNLPIMDLRVPVLQDRKISIEL